MNHYKCPACSNTFAEGTSHVCPSAMRTFAGGATRNVDTDKLDFEGFLSPVALKAYAEYMHRHRLQSDGQLRSSSNWKKGIPIDEYMRSMWRHFFSVWEAHTNGTDPTEELSALFFNVQGMLHETIRINNLQRRVREALRVDSEVEK